MNSLDDKTYEMSLLYDFFGDFLTEKQREYFDLYYNEDLSLSEIAENVGITRQGVRDIIVRAENILTEAERKTGIVSRYLSRNAEIDRATELAHRIRELSSDDEISSIADELCGVLTGLKN